MDAAPTKSARVLAAPPPLPWPRVDCCVTLGKEVSDGWRVPDGVDWRLWLTRSSVLRNDNAFLALRVVLALFMDAVLFGSVTLMSQAHPGYWCIYLTHWTLVVVCAHLTLSVAGALAARASLARGEPPPTRPWWLPVLWSAQAIALPGSLLVFVLFWALVYPGWPDAAKFPINYFVHGANFGAMALDAVMSSAPYFFVYIWSSWVVYAIIYVLFTIAYFCAGGTDENGNPYIYAVIYWGSASGASGAGLLTGLIVFVLVPLLGLLAYWLVFLRRARLAKEVIPPGPPGCAPPAGPVVTRLSVAADAMPLLRFLTAAGTLLLGATFCASTPATVLLPNQTYWQARLNGTAAAVPYISDTGADSPAYEVFAAGLTGGALLLAAGFRLVYERMDARLAAIDAAQGRFGRCGEGLAECTHAAAPVNGEHELALCAPVQADAMAADDGDANGNGHASEGDTPRSCKAGDDERDSMVAELTMRSAPLRTPCWCSTGRWLHCCCCCTQSLRQQGRSAFICGMVACAGLPLLGWSSVRVQIFVHSFGAAATFGCTYLHMCVLARLAAARVAAAAAHPGNAALAVTRADARSATLKATCVWSVPVGAAICFIIVLPACGSSAGYVWSAYLAAVMEWAYAGVMALHVVSLAHEAGLPPLPEERSSDAAKAAPLLIVASPEAAAPEV